SFVVHRKSNGPQEITSPFYESLKQSVNSYHEQFIDWENRQSVDIARLRHTFLPLFEQTKHLDIKDLMGYHEILLKNTFYSKQIFKSLLAIILARLVNCEQ